MTTCLGKRCSFCLPRVPFVNCRQFMYLVISLFGFEGRIWDLIVSVPDHCLSFYFSYDESYPKRHHWERQHHFESTVGDNESTLCWVIIPIQTCLKAFLLRTNLSSVYIMAHTCTWNSCYVEVYTMNVCEIIIVHYKNRNGIYCHFFLCTLF